MSITEQASNMETNVLHVVSKYSEFSPLLGVENAFTIGSLEL